MSDMSEESIVPVEQASLEQHQGTNGLQSTHSEAASGNNLEKIKELLFGAQMREYEKRVLRLEQRIIRDYAELQSDVQQRLNTIELNLRQELQSLGLAIATEQSQREESVKALNDQTKSGLTEVGKQVNQFVEQMSQQQQELRQQILTQAETIEEEIRQNYRELLAVLDRRIQALQTDKIDRTALASLLRELALRVNNHDISDVP